MTVKGHRGINVIKIADLLPPPRSMSRNVLSALPRVRPCFWDGVPKLRLWILISALSCSGGMSSTRNSFGSSTKACCRSRMIFLRMVFFMERCRSRCFTSLSVSVLLLSRRRDFFFLLFFGLSSSPDVEPTDTALSWPGAFSSAWPRAFSHLLPKPKMSRR